ncbi:alpha-galactosidase [Aurantimicrobium minutum]|uniref:alpha-galactosidase n=1 Tax=Aurantimicrobium minutum TaxID=708131 RepID=UPI00247586F3|nr:alpha-galactosidase [Aurantimicrobium minutum]MDH6207076.1 alpha-galactosidase [Aurantimicrobium minutum]
MKNTETTFSISTSDVELIVDTTSGTPVVAHWGRKLAGSTSHSQISRLLAEATPHSDLDFPQNPGLWRERARGFFGASSLVGRRGRLDWAPLFSLRTVASSHNVLTFVSADDNAGLEVTVKFELTPEGVLLIDEKVTNTGSSDYAVDELTVWMPLPDRAVESMDFHGRWVKERQPQRLPINYGTFSREIRDGRSGHGYTIVQLAMTEHANNATGEVWSLGLLWSGNTKHSIDKQETGYKAIGAGEILEPGEIVLEPGESYSAPTVAATYSDAGFNGISYQLHRWVRAREQHPTKLKPRPLTLNVWEAVYFDHRLGKLLELLDVAKEIGVERFVLDDGWFGSRRDDHSGLGDWTVSSEVWPDGLGPLVTAVHDAGLEFGLWFEGEMVQVDSDLYRAHPEWILHIPGRIPLEARRQLVLDLTHEGAYQHVLGQVDAVLSEYDVDYIKWDHNRTLIDPGHEGIAAAHEQTLAIYRLFDELKRRHPGLEIESCSSGGARIDLGMVQHADRFWGSDCNDALERQSIQRYTSFAIPPELIGAHIGPTHCHTTGRVHELSFRAITALFGHAGLEWDLTETTPEERVHLASWAQYYKDKRELLHSGKVVRVDHSEDSSFVHGVVAHDKSEALFAYVQLSTGNSTKPDSVLLTDLDPEATYEVKVVQPAGQAQFMQIAVPPVLNTPIVASGALLADIGIQPPILRPENAILFEITKVS